MAKFTHVARTLELSLLIPKPFTLFDPFLSFTSFVKAALNHSIRIICPGHPLPLPSALSDIPSSMITSCIALFPPYSGNLNALALTNVFPYWVVLTPQNSPTYVSLFSRSRVQPFVASSNSGEPTRIWVWMVNLGHTYLPRLPRISSILVSPPQNRLRIVNWNVNSVRSVYRRDFFQTFLMLYPADILCLTETRTGASQLAGTKSKDGEFFWNHLEPQGYKYNLLNTCTVKPGHGYHRTAIFSKIPPLTRGIGDETHIRVGSPELLLATKG